MLKQIESLAKLVGSILQNKIQLDSKIVVIYKSKAKINTIVKAKLFLYKLFYIDIIEERKEEVLEEF